MQRFYDMNKAIKYIIIFSLLQVISASITFAQENTPTLTSATYEENLKRWQNMSEEQRESIRAKMHTIGSEERKIIRQNAEKFRKLPEKEKQRIKSNFQKFRKLPNEKRKDLKSRHKRFRQLPLKQRQKLRQRMHPQKKKRGTGGHNRRSKKIEQKNQNRPKPRNISQRQPISDQQKDAANQRQKRFDQKEQIGPKGQRIQKQRKNSERIPDRSPQKRNRTKKRSQFNGKLNRTNKNIDRKKLRKRNKGQNTFNSPSWKKSNNKPANSRLKRRKPRAPRRRK